MSSSSSDMLHSWRSWRVPDESPRRPPHGCAARQLDRALPVPVGDQRVEGGRALGAAVGARRGPGPQHPGPHRAAAARPAPPTSSSSARRRVVRAGGQPRRGRRGPGVERVEVVAQQVGGAGQRLGDPALQHVLEQRQHLVPQPDPLERRVGVVRVVPRRAGPAPRTRPRSSRGAARAAAAGSARRPAAMPAIERGPEPRPSPSSTVSAWSSRVCPSSTCAPSGRGGRGQRGVAGGAGGGLGAAGRADSTGTISHRVQAELVAERGDPARPARPSRAAGRGRR